MICSGFTYEALCIFSPKILMEIIIFENKLDAQQKRVSQNRDGPHNVSLYPMMRVVEPVFCKTPLC